MSNIKSNIVSLSNKYPSNVIPEEIFKKRITDIFNLISNDVSKTAGPYGGGTLIEELGSYHMTKDGFTVLKHIHFNNRIDNTILNLIRTISHQMVMKVGDGSTTAILAAHEFLDRVNKDPILKKIRPKDIQEYIKNYVDKLCKNIQENSNNITDENFVDIMEKIARVATNDNEEYTRFIKEIYEKSGKETYISKRMSLTDKPKYEIMDDMFYIAGRYIDRVYCNAESGAKCNLVHPNILLFNFTLGNEHFDIIKIALNWMMKNKPTERILVIAPNYDQYFLDKARSDAHDFMTAYAEQSGAGGAIPFPVVFAKNPYYKPVERLIFEDLAPLLGTQVFSPFNAEGFTKKLTNYYKIASEYNQAISTKKKAEDAYRARVIEAQRLGKDIKSIEHIDVPVPEKDGKKELEELENDVSKFFGTCEAVSVGEEKIEFHGFCNINQPLVDVHILDAQNEFQKELDEIENQAYISKEYINAKERLSRIACKSAVIYVGGHSELEKKLNDDSLDDAIRACQSTLTYGYSLGNNLAIFRAMVDVITDNEIDDSIAENMYQSFLAVINTIQRNKNPNITIKETEDIIAESLNENKCYDLNTEEYSEDIINSCRTDIEILKGAISIVGTLLIANQYLASEVQTDKK